jgi:hypothetical protein
MMMCLTECPLRYLCNAVSFHFLWARTQAEKGEALIVKTGGPYAV